MAIGIITRAVFDQNAASNRGGGIFVAPNSVLTMNTDATLHGNTAELGGGIYTLGEATLTSVHVTENHADNGGGVYQDASNAQTLTISASEFYSNSASMDGGAIWIDHDNIEKLSVIDSAFDFNTASVGYTEHQDADDTTYDTNIAGNTSWSDRYTQGYNNYDIGGRGMEGYNISMSVDVIVTKNPVGSLMQEGAFTFGLFTYDEPPDMVATATNDANGYVRLPLENIDSREEFPKNYYIQEISGPPGWDLDTEQYPVSIDVNGDVLHVQYDDRVSANAVNTMQTDTCGLIEFPELTFTEPGSYVYTIKEEPDTTPGSNWSQDPKEYTVTIHVEADESGNMHAVADYGDEFPTFVDTYTGKNAKIIISACKTAVGASLPDGKFEFALYDEDGTQIDTAWNDPAAAITTRSAQTLVDLTRQRRAACLGKEIVPREKPTGKRGKKPKPTRRYVKAVEFDPDSMLRRLRKLEDKVTKCTMQA